MFPRRVQPIWYLEFAGAKSLARLGFLETSARSIVSGVVPLAALDALGDKQAVSWAYVVGAACALIVTLNVGMLERRFARRWVTTLGLVFLIASAATFTFIDGAMLAVGIGLLASAASVFSVTLSLFIMESVEKRELARAESRRLVWAGAAWFIGPAGGVWLYESVSQTAPFLVSAVLASAAIGYFWALRLGSNPALSEPTSTATNPLVTVPKYFKQRYLRIAYLVTLVRAMFWVAIFVYGSIYVIEAGLPNWAAGVFLSCIAALLFFAPAVSVLSDRVGTRTTIMIGFAAIAAGMVFLTLLGAPTWVGIIGWAVSAIGASIVDVVGNIPFMRTVKRRDRVPMTAVFSSWRDVSALAAPAAAGLVLIVFPFWVFYLLLAGLAGLAGVSVSFLPRRI